MNLRIHNKEIYVYFQRVLETKMSFIDSLEDTSVNKEFLNLLEENEITPREELINEVFLPASHSSSQYEESSFGETETGETSIDCASFGKEAYGIYKKTNSFCFKESDFTNVEPSVGSTEPKFNANFACALMPPSGVFNTDQSISDFWNSQYEYTQGNSSVNDWNYTNM